MDSALHYPEVHAIPSELQQQALDDVPCCPGCAAQVVTTHVPVGRSRRTDLAFYRHPGDCSLRRVPACWIIGSATANAPLPDAHLRPEPIRQMRPRQQANAFQSVVPEEARRCPLCAGRLARPGWAAQHQDRCLIAAAPAAVRMLTAGEALQALNQHQPPSP
ncbi:hypothetical protein JK361_37315 [Streptomyces sp. 5-8]|uniref:Transcription factor WhiB n=1 Tax=Streptomyces musisoli TaxID=2802280 RepID=A0ABS1PE82_9ACTN|nr:hypothetical protein [Streptomyces musisoli]MBL1110156.1 hypothetical protein [Streptomyces musisoli]